MTAENQWFIKTQSGKSGPFTFKELQYFADRGKIKPNTAISDREDSWIKAKRVGGLYFPSEPPPESGHQERPVMPDSSVESFLDQSSPFGVAADDSALSGVLDHPFDDDATGDQSPRTAQPNRQSSRAPEDRGEPFTDEGELCERHAALAAREAKLATREADLASREGAISDREANLAGRESALRDREAQADALEMEVRSRESDVACREADVGLRETEVGRREAELRRREANFLTRESESAEQKESSAEKQAEHSR